MYFQKTWDTLAISLKSKLINFGFLHINKTCFTYTLTAIVEQIKRDLKWYLLYSVDFSLSSH